MTLSFDATSTTTLTTASGNTVSWTHTPVGIPDIALACISWQDNGSAGGHVSGVTYGGTTMTRFTGGNVDRAIEVYYLLAPPTGAQTIAVTWDLTTAYGAICGGLTFIGNGKTVATALGTLFLGGAASTTPSVTVTPKKTTSIVVGLLLVLNGATTTVTITTDAGEVEKWNNQAGTTGASTRTGGAGSIQLQGGDGVMNWTLGTSKTWVVRAFEVLEAVGIQSMPMMGIGG